MKNNLPLFWSLRALIAFLFIFSAVTKLMPIGAFEHQLVTDGITNVCFAPILARCIIGFELFLGIAFLQNHYFRKFILPATTAMIVAFCIYLTYQISSKGNSGNCGCMGQIIPMTPAQALTKNIITLCILGFLFFITPKKRNSLHRYPAAILLVSFIALFLLFKPECDCALENVTNMTIPEMITPATPIDSVASITTENTAPVKVQDPKKKNNDVPVKEIPTKEVLIEQPAVPTIQRRTSAFAPYTSFSNGVTANVDHGKSIVCLFNSDCDHCMNTAKEICELSKEMKLPPVYILFWGEESQAAAFFKFAGCSFPYTFIDAGKFFRLLDKAPSPPRVVVLNEGNIMGDFTSETFSKTGLKDAINK